ncbi:MAG: DUF1592 domain-containing protein [Planctomycetaceae bacterium]|nr:DUF1592 domain-containing protein [Planctomycetaceae bacterium]
MAIRKTGQRTIAAIGSLLVCLTASSLLGADSPFVATMTPFLRDYCFDCHSDSHAEANVNLKKLVSSNRFLTQFRTWERVVELVENRQMPPAEISQPNDSQRRLVLKAIRSKLEEVAEQKAGDPGPVAIRRLTSAEYAYVMADLTGMELNLNSVLSGDAVGGEGFSNVGDVQFVQDSTLERYLEAAKLVAGRAVIGAGPLGFFDAPGKTGLELSAITRIQAIYRQYGFRSAAGEGGEPFGLELYPRAFFVAWQFQHRNQLGNAQQTLHDLAQQEDVSARFVDHIWQLLNRSDVVFPLSEISAAYRSLPVPNHFSDAAAKIEIRNQARRDCQKMAELLRSWQTRLASRVSDNEDALLLSVDSIQLDSEALFDIRLMWQEDAERASVQFITRPATEQPIENSLIVWSSPTVQFRDEQGEMMRAVPLNSLLPNGDEIKALFGSERVANQQPIGNQEARVNLAEHDLLMTGNSDLEIELMIPPGAVSANLSVKAILKTEISPQAVVRCTVRDGSTLGVTAADQGQLSAILGRSEGAGFTMWKAGLREFATTLPDISHREPAPSDRDPIPAPYENDYNHPERNDFHYSIKYHRDDQFLVDKMLDDAIKERLDQAWCDLLLSFDYHDRYFAFLIRKNGLGENLNFVDETKIGKITPEWISKLPVASRSIARRLVDSYQEASRVTQDASPSHVDQAVLFAQLAWRRELDETDRKLLHEFYREMRQSEMMSHSEAVRSLLVRILMAPEFLYRIERASADPDLITLDAWELASRLSFFLWSSSPDEELRRLAQQDRLDQQELTRQVRRMLRDPKARRFATEFFGQWFGFYRFDDFGGIDLKRFPEFDERLKRSFYEEAVAFFEYLVREERPCDEILFADYAHWNQSLALHYGAASERTSQLGDELERISDLGMLRRGGLLGLGAIHATTSAPLRTSAVKRGDWILRRVLGTPVPPPPDDVGSISADDVLGDGRTVRERLEMHRQEASCMSCHARIDPLGFALENFDPIGRWRDQYRDGQPIDVVGRMGDGSRIDGLIGLKSYLRSELPKFHRTLASKLVGYGLGRAEILSDRRLIQQLMEGLEAEATVADLATRIVTSKQFRTKRAAVVPVAVGAKHGISK